MGLAAGRATVTGPGGGMKVHPAADLLPAMSTEEFASLKVDIAGNGLRQPIVLHLGTVLDGRHRLRACKELGVEPLFVDFDGGDPIAFVLSSNVHRRHLTASQRAAVAVEAETMFKAQAEKRQRAAGPRSAAKRIGKTVTPKREEASDGGEAIGQAAKAVGASRTTAAKAKAVKKAAPEKFEAIKRGEVTVDAAAKQVAAERAAAVEKSMEKAVRAMVPGAAEDIDRARLKATYSKHMTGVGGLLALDPKKVAEVLDDLDLSLCVGLTSDLAKWAQRVAGGGLRVVKEQA